MSQANIHENIAKLRDRVRRACANYQRKPADLAILAVSKTRPAEDVRQAYDAGCRDFGENYLQEALDKIAALSDLPLQWHFIGPIQSNKTRAIAEHFHWVHSVDRLKIARRLSEQRPPQLPPLNICLQVNVSGEASKSGCSLADLPELVSQCRDLPNLALRGLMAIPAPAEDETAQRLPFAELATALSRCQSLAPDMDTLSMGMSADMEAAIAEGATIVRVGTDIFGPRLT